MSQEQEQEKQYKKDSSPGIEMKDFGKKKYFAFAPLVRTDSGGETQLGSSFQEGQKFASQEGERPSSSFWQSKRAHASAKKERLDVENLKYLLNKAATISSNPSDAQLKGLVFVTKLRYTPDSKTSQSLERLWDDAYRSSILEEIRVTSATDTEAMGINVKSKKSKKRKLKSKKLLKKGRHFTRSKSKTKSRKQKNKH
uniref:Uncharacterized protein n=1 Tax=viral metagenome TaxID=1070528 RepID=A0A6C0F3C9_9ZZZZ